MKDQESVEWAVHQPYEGIPCNVHMPCNDKKKFLKIWLLQTIQRFNIVIVPSCSHDLVLGSE